MAMWLGDSAGEAKPLLARIDLTPMIGVLAALLVVMVAQWPALSRNVPLPMAPEGIWGGDGLPPVELLIDYDGTVIWDDVHLLPGEFEKRLSQLDRLDVPPELHVRVPRTLRYQYVADVAEAAHRHKLHVGFGEL
jgi:biopolymer transport protein ExbD